MQWYNIEKLVTKIAFLTLATVEFTKYEWLYFRGLPQGGAAGGAAGSDNRDLGQQTTDQSLQQKVGNSGL